MSQAETGRMIAVVGVVLGFVAIFLDYTSGLGISVKYSDDGTVLAFLLITLILAALQVSAGLRGRGDRDCSAAVTGSMAFGFFLLIPMSLGFNHWGNVGAGGWLGVCAGLIPLGMWISLGSQPGSVNKPQMDLAARAIAGRILCLIAIWLSASDGTSYWNLADKGRALPIVMLLLVVGGGALGASMMSGAAGRRVADGALILAAITFGLYEALLIGNAFGEFGRLDSGAWLGSVGAAILMISAKRLWRAAVRA